MIVLPRHLALALIVFGATLARGATEIAITGWPAPELGLSAPPLELGDDPVLGRQVCPPFTRLNLAQGKSEDLLVRRIVEEFRDAKRGALWRYELRDGLHWWSGAELKPAEAAASLASALPQLVLARGAGLWKLPHHEITVEGRDLVVRWKEPPEFGPYILNGLPLWRTAANPGKGPKFECVGVYRPELRPFGVVLLPNRGYSVAAKLPELAIYAPGAPEAAKLDKKTPQIAFRHAALFDGAPHGGDSDAPPGCAQLVELPLATVIAWNTTRGLTADPAFRALLTQLTPRGALVRSAAATLGELLSAPIPRVHPGYDGKVLVRPFDLDVVSRSLDGLGYPRKTPSSPRAGKDGTALTLRIVAESGAASLAAKVLVDAFAAVGIAVTFVDEANLTEKELRAADGHLAAVALDWPRADFLANFHSKASEPGPFWPLADGALDLALERYALSLTTATPSFQMLQAVHKRLYELEPVTVILQHKACFDRNVNTKDPDWFRHIIMERGAH